MSWIDDKIMDITQSPAVAAAAGSLLSLGWMPIGSTWMNKISSLGAGLGSAVYLVPWLVSVVGIDSAKAVLAFSFIGGFLGLLALSRAWDYVSTTPFGELLTSLFTRKQQ